MPTTRTHMKSQKSRGAEMLSDIENAEFNRLSGEIKTLNSNG